MVRVTWPRALRLVRSIYPPIDLFEDIVDPADWEAVASLESKTNPRIWEEIGRLDLVPVERRVSGEGATIVMAPFVHCSADRPGRFTDGPYGIYSAGDDEEVAIREVAHHHGLSMTSVNEKPGWHSQFRMMVGSLDADLVDLRENPDVHDPDSWLHSQKIGREARSSGANGLVYNSVRCSGGQCAAIFWPDIIPIPVQGDHFQLHWNGAVVDRVLNLTSKREYRLAA